MAKRKSKTEAARADTFAMVLPCDFGNLNIGDSTASISVRVLREHLKAATADSWFCGRRISGAIYLGDVNPVQKSFIDDNIVSIRGTFDIKSIGLSRKVVRIPLALPIAEIDLETLSGFAKKHGTLGVRESTEMPAKAKASKHAAANGDQKELEEDEEGDDDNEE